MKTIARIAALAALATMSVSCASQKIAVTAHRGFWKCEEAGYAENSIKSLEAAQNAGLWGSEFDVQMTSDLVILVHHDPKIDGVCIWDHDYADFKDSRLKNGEKIPTLDEYLTQGEKSKKTVLVFELKQQIDKQHEDYMVDQSVKALKEHGIYDPKRVIFISFSMNMCERLAALCPGFTVQYLNGDVAPEELAAKGINGIDYHYKVLNANPEWIKEAKKLKMSVNSWTVNKEKNIKEMIDLGVDCITTNEPLLVREKLGKNEKVK
jgi:glycerophosphoryl diester phosphodiesterase